jgi:hypothetical protein
VDAQLERAPVEGLPELRELVEVQASNAQVAERRDRDGALCEAVDIHKRSSIFGHAIGSYTEKLNPSTMSV